MNRKQLSLCEQGDIRTLGRKLSQRLAPKETQKPSEIADGMEGSFNSRKLKAWHMVQEAGATGNLRMLEMIDKLTIQYDRAFLSDDTAEIMARSHRNDILEEDEKEADV